MGKTIDERVRNLYLTDQTAAGAPTEEGEVRRVSNDLIAYLGGSAISLTKGTTLRENVALVDITNGSVSGTVGDWNDAFDDLQNAIDACSAGQSVWVLPGNHTGAYTAKAGVNVFLWEGATITGAAGAGTVTAFTMAADMTLSGGGIVLTASSGGVATGVDFGIAAAHMTSRVINTRITGTGAGTTHGVDLSGVTGVADESHYCIEGVRAQLVSETAGRGVVGGGTSATNNAHIKDCNFVMVGAGGVALEVIGLISAPDCYFWGTSDGVLNVSPSTDNILRYGPSTRWNTRSGAGGYTFLGGFSHTFEGNAVFVDDAIGSDEDALISDKSRPYKTVQAGLNVAASGDICYVAAAVYSEDITIPAGVVLVAPGATITTVTMGAGSTAYIGKLLPGASATGIACAVSARIDIGTILLSGTSAVGVATTSDANLVGRIGRIIEDGAQTTTTALSLVGTSILSLNVSEIDADVAWNVGSGTTLNLFVNDSTGTETETGTANITKAGVTGGITVTNTAIVTKGGNDGTGVVGDWGKPFLTIGAAITACSAGQTVLVFPGTYTEAIACHNGVSVRGTDQVNCIINRAASGAATVVALNQNLLFENFTVNIATTTADACKGLSISNFENETTVCRNITINGTGDSAITAISPTFVGTPARTHFTFENIHVNLSATGSNALLTASSGLLTMKNCHIKTVGYGAIMSCTALLRGCSFFGGTGGLLVTKNIELDKATTYSALNISGGVFTVLGGLQNMQSQATTPLALTFADSGKFFNNKGAAAEILFNLPLAATGLKYTFIVEDVDGLGVVASITHSIRHLGDLTGGSRKIASVEKGASLTLIGISTNEWYVVNSLGTWTLT